MKTTQVWSGAYREQAGWRAETEALTGASDKAPRNLESYRGTTGQMPRLVLDSEVHWDWRNPLNVIPAVLVLLMVYALAGTFL